MIVFIYSCCLLPVIFHGVSSTTPISSSTVPSNDLSHRAEEQINDLATSANHSENSPSPTKRPVPCFPGFQCVHGFCVTGLSCQCDNGWTGPLCSDPQQAPSLSATPQPKLSLTEAGSDSDRTATTVGDGAGGENRAAVPENDECSPGFVCIHGSCEQGLIQCICREGWTGTFCHISADLSDPVDNSTQQPITTNTDFTFRPLPVQGMFSPLPGYGPLADLAVRVCVPNSFECRYGNCSTDQGFGCECEPGFFGTFCENPCLADCGPNAVCTEAGCECLQNYTGKNCSELRPLNDIDDVEQGSYFYAVGVSVAVVVIVAVVMVVVLYSLWRRGNITMLKLVFRFQGAEEDDERQYDAFVSYASTEEDRQFVLEALIPVLENEMEFTLCIHERDFMPGKYITANIMDSVRQSRRTLLVISPAFVCRNWCKFEFQAAVAEMIEQKHRILPVILGDLKEIKQESTQYETFQQVIEMVTYLQYPGNSASDQELRRFWKRLELSMPKKLKRTTSSPQTPSTRQPSLQKPYPVPSIRQEPKGTELPPVCIPPTPDTHSITLEPTPHSYTNNDSTDNAQCGSKSGEKNFISRFRKQCNRIKTSIQRSNQPKRYSVNYHKNVDHSEIAAKYKQDSDPSVNHTKDGTSSNDNSLNKIEKGDNRPIQIISDWTWPTDTHVDSSTSIIQETC